MSKIVEFELNLVKIEKNMFPKKFEIVKTLQQNVSNSVGEGDSRDGGVGDGGGGGVGGAVPSTLREEKVATFCLAVVVTLRLPEAGGGEGWIRRGRAGGGGGLEGAAATEAVVEAKVAWCRAALTLAFSFFAGPR